MRQVALPSGPDDLEHCRIGVVETVASLHFPEPGWAG